MYQYRCNFYVDNNALKNSQRPILYCFIEKEIKTSSTAWLKNFDFYNSVRFSKIIFFINKRTPRSLIEYKNWRAHEFLHFILIYSITVFHEMFNVFSSEMSNAIALQIFIKTLFRRCIKTLF